MSPHSLGTPVSPYSVGILHVPPHSLGSLVSPPHSGHPSCAPHYRGTSSDLAPAWGRRGWCPHDTLCLSHRCHRSPPSPHHLGSGALLGVGGGVLWGGQAERGSPGSRVSPASHPPPPCSFITGFAAMRCCPASAERCCSPLPTASMAAAPRTPRLPPCLPVLLPVSASASPPPMSPLPGAEHPFCCGSRSAGRERGGCGGGGHGAPRLQEHVVTPPPAPSHGDGVTLCSQHRGLEGSLTLHFGGGAAGSGMDRDGCHRLRCTPPAPQCHAEPVGGTAGPVQ